MTDVLITSDLPDVRRARIAEERQEGARGHLTPDAAAAAAKNSDWDDPIDAGLMMSALAVDVSPKIEDNYDYSLLEEFEASAWCPRPTRMVNTACGGGEAAVHFAKRGFRCVGIDADRAQIGLARERAWLAGVDIDFMVGDLFETPNLLPAESFGLAIDRGGFSSLEDDRARQRYLANGRRLLFQGGVFLLSAGFFPVDEDKKLRAKRQESKVLLAREGGVVVGEMMQGGFQLLERVLRPTQDSGELAELLLYLRKP
jgi:SAM-dependent methyltransferase